MSERDASSFVPSSKRSARLVAAVAGVSPFVFFALGLALTGASLERAANEGRGFVHAIVAGLGIAAIGHAVLFVRGVATPRRHAALFVAPAALLLLGTAGLVASYRRLVHATLDADLSFHDALYGQLVYEVLAAPQIATLAAGALALATGAAMILSGRLADRERDVVRSEAGGAFGTLALGGAMCAFVAAHAVSVQRAVFGALATEEADRRVRLIVEGAAGIARAVEIRDAVHAGASLGVLVLVWSVAARHDPKRDRAAAAVALAWVLLPHLASRAAIVSLARGARESASASVVVPRGVDVVRGFEGLDPVEPGIARAALVRDALVLPDGSRRPLDAASLVDVLARLPRVGAREDTAEQEPEFEEDERNVSLRRRPRIEVLLDRQATRSGLLALLTAATNTDLANVCFVGFARSREESAALQRVRDVELAFAVTGELPAATCIHLGRAIDRGSPGRIVESFAFVGNEVAHRDLRTDDGQLRRRVATVRFDVAGDLATLFTTLFESGVQQYVFESVALGGTTP